MTKRSKPVFLELDADTSETPETAPPVPEGDPVTYDRAAMIQVARAMKTRNAGKSGWITKLFWWSVSALFVTMISTMAWDFVISLSQKNIWLGRFVMGLGGIALFTAFVVVMRELASLSRLKRLDRLAHQAKKAASDQDAVLAREVVSALTNLYRDRSELDWARQNVKAQAGDMMDADALIHLAERAYLEPLDLASREVIETSARQVATTTAIVPLALADVVAALVVNLRMIRQIAQIYGGRAGTMGSWRLLRAVATHLAATGVVAVGDDMVGSMLGGSALSKLSRRFGEGIVNGTLTARVGIAAMEVCRPLPFDAVKKPSTSGLVKRALTGLWS